MNKQRKAKGLKPITFATPKIPFPRTGIGITPIPIILPPLPGGPAYAKGGRRIPGKKSRGSLPSFGAIFFKQFKKGGTPAPFKGKFFTGLESRAIDPLKFKFILPGAKTKLKPKKKTKKKKK